MGTDLRNHINHILRHTENLLDNYEYVNCDSFPTFIYDDSPVSPIIFYCFNHVLFGVAPIDPVIVQIIYGQAIWPAKVLRNQNSAMLPIHPGGLDFRLLSLVGPEHEPVTENSQVAAFCLVVLP